jgi:hypothetical protein
MEDSLETQLDEALDGIEFEEATEDEVATESEDANLEAAPDESEGQADLSEPPSDPYDTFGNSGNFNDLPDGPARERMLQLYREFQSRSERLAGYERRERKPEPPKQVEPDGPPTIDFTASDEEIQKQFQEGIKWAAKAGADEVRKELAPIQDQMSQRETADKQAALYNHLTAKEGYTPEIEAKMAEEMSRHFDSVTGQVNPQWKDIMTTPEGLDMLFENISLKYGQTKTQDEAAKRNEAKQRTPAPAKTKHGESMTPAERFADADLDDVLDSAISGML